MVTQSFVDSVIKEIIQPGADELVELPCFKDFLKAMAIFECLARTSKTNHGMLLGSAPSNIASMAFSATTPFIR